MKELNSRQGRFWNSSFVRLLFLGAVILVSSLYLLGDHSVKADSNEELSLFSSSVIFSQNDYKKEDFLTLKDDYLKQGAKEGVLLAISPINIESEILPEKGSPESAGRQEVIKYKVKEGDVISVIAARYGLGTQTLLWANNLNEHSIIRPGDIIKIPPADGVLYKVKAGDTLSGIAKKYHSDINKIIEFNQLKSDKIFEGQELFLPGGKMVTLTPTPTPTSKQSIPVSRPTITYRSYSKGCHRFPYGYCTWYVAQKRCIPWGGNASAWLQNARAAGYATGSEPVPGAIMVTKESWWGHVAYVESVSGNYVTISEMNKYGWGRVNYRTLNKDSWVIRGYIY